MRADVFISYSRTGATARARDLHRALEAADISTFRDERSISPGDAFPAEIAEGLFASRVIVLLLDASYFERPWCMREFQVAVSEYRVSGHPQPSQLDHVVVAFEGSPSDGTLAALPPPLAQRSWPKAEQTSAIVSLVKDRLERSPLPLGARLTVLDDLAVNSLR
jgi:hypothetical protein